MAVEIVRLLALHTALLQTLGSGEFGLKHNHAAAFNNPFVVGLRLFLEEGDKLAVSEAFGRTHGLGRFFDYGEAAVSVIGKRGVQPRLKVFAACVSQ